MTEDFDLRNEAEQPSDGDMDRVLRPACFDDFTGQRAALENLGVFVQAAANRGEALDHTLLHGPPGLRQDDPCEYHRERIRGIHSNHLGTRP